MTVITEKAYSRTGFGKHDVANFGASIFCWEETSETEFNLRLNPSMYYKYDETFYVQSKDYSLRIELGKHKSAPISMRDMKMHRNLYGNVMAPREPVPTENYVERLENNQIYVLPVFQAQWLHNSFGDWLWLKTVSIDHLFKHSLKEAVDIYNKEDVHSSLTINTSYLNYGRMELTGIEVNKTVDGYCNIQ